MPLRHVTTRVSLVIRTLKITHSYGEPPYTDDFSFLKSLKLTVEVNEWK